MQLPADCSQISWPDLSKLHTLGLTITSSTCRWKFGCVLHHTISLKTLELSPCVNGLCLTAEDWEDIAQYIATCSSLKKLSFASGFEVYFEDNQALYIITKALANNHSIQLEYLYFSAFWGPIIDDGNDFAEYLSNATSLLELSLPEFTRISCSSLLKVARALTYKPHLLNTLSDQVHKMFTVEGDQDLSAFIQLIKHFPEMIKNCEVDIEKISNEGLKQLATTLKTDTCIECLFLSRQEITSNGAKVLAEALSSNNHVCYLILSHNKIDYEGAHALAKMLCSNKCLYVLDLSDNHIDDEGAHALAKMLYSNKCLRILDLSGNLIEDGGAMALVQAFHNTSLICVYLTENPSKYANALDKTLQ